MAEARRRRESEKNPNIHPRNKDLKIKSLDRQIEVLLDALENADNLKDNLIKGMKDLKAENKKLKDKQSELFQRIADIEAAAKASQKVKASAQMEPKTIEANTKEHPDRVEASAQTDTTEMVEQDIQTEPEMHLPDENSYLSRENDRLSAELQQTAITVHTLKLQQSSMMEAVTSKQLSNDEIIRSLQEQLKAVQAAEKESIQTRTQTEAKRPNVLFRWWLRHNE